MKSLCGREMAVTHLPPLFSPSLRIISAISGRISGSSAKTRYRFAFRATSSTPAPEYPEKPLKGPAARSRGWSSPLLRITANTARSISSPTARPAAAASSLVSNRPFTNLNTKSCRCMGSASSSLDDSSWFRVVSVRIPLEICCSSSRGASPSGRESIPVIARIGFACRRAIHSARARLSTTKTGRIARLLKIFRKTEALMSAFRNTAV